MKDVGFVSTLKITAKQAIRFVDLATLAALGVEVARYSDRTYDRTQEIADAVVFLGFVGLIASSARWSR